MSMQTPDFSTGPFSLGNLSTCSQPNGPSRMRQPGFELQLIKDWVMAGSLPPSPTSPPAFTSKSLFAGFKSLSMREGIGVGGRKKIYRRS
jgi:hypothetical protein